MLQEEFEQTQHYTSLYLERKEGAKTHDRTQDYGKGDIYNIEYSLDDLDSDEKLIKDFKFFLKLYDYLYEQRGTTIFTDEELEKEKNPVEEHIEKGEEVSPQVIHYSTFIDYLNDKNYFFDEKIENYLLSLKVNPLRF